MATNPIHKMDSEKSVYLDREEHIHKGALAGKVVVPYYYDSNTDTLTPATQPTAGTGGAGDASAANQVTEQGLIGPVNETAPTTDTASSGLNGRLQRIAQRLTSLIGLLPGSLGQKARASSLAVTLSTEDVTTLTPQTNALTDTQLRATPVPVSGTVTANTGLSQPLTDAQLRASAVPVTATGNVAHDAVDSGNPVKFGGKVSTSTPTNVVNGQRTDAWFDEFGRQVVTDRDPETGYSQGTTSLRDRLVAQRYTVLSDSIADGFASFWTFSTTGSGFTPVVGSGEGTLQTGAAINSSSQMVSTVMRYFPGQVSWFNSAFRFAAATTGNVQRIGACTVSGTTPQDGFYFEQNGTTLDAVVVKAGVEVSRTASTSWSRATQTPWTPTTNYTSYELRYTANSVNFLINNVIRHTVSGTTSPITATLDFPMLVQNINTTNATNVTISIRNIGMGRFGTPPTDYTSGSIVADQTGAGGVLTFTFPTPVDFIWVTDTGATTTNVSRVDPFGGTPAASTGIPVLNGAPTPISVVPASSTIKVYAPSGSTIGMYGLRYV